MSLRVPEAVYLEAPDELAAKCHAIAVCVDAPSPRRLLDLHRVWKPGFPCRLASQALPNEDPALFAASLGMNVVLEADTAWAPGVLEALADYFLYAPTLEARIDPFAFVATSIAEGSGLNLWTFYAEALGRNFYVDEEERVSLSPRWVAAGHFFGTARDDLETLQASELWRHVEGLRHRTFAEQTACATCHHYPWCAGFWRAIDADADCSAWQAGMGRIFDAWRTMQETG